MKAKVVGKIDLSNIPKNVPALNRRIEYLLSNHWIDADTKDEFSLKQKKIQNSAVQLQFLCSELERVIDALKLKYEPKRIT